MPRGDPGGPEGVGGGVGVLGVGEDGRVGPVVHAQAGLAGCAAPCLDCFAQEPGRETGPAEDVLVVAGIDALLSVMAHEPGMLVAGGKADGDDSRELWAAEAGRASGHESVSLIGR